MTHYQQTPAPQPEKKKRRKLPWILAGIVVIGGIAIATSGGDDTASVSTDAPDAAVGAVPAEDPKPSGANPLEDNGTFLVGSEIQPGTYRVAPDEGFMVMPYWERCADVTCDMSGSGGVLGAVIQNEAVSGPGFITIEPTDVAVKLTDVTLTPMG